MEPGDSVDAASGSFDKTRVLDVKPLRCLAPLFPSPPPFASQPPLSSSSPSPFICAQPRGPLPAGFAPFYPFHDPSAQTPSDQIPAFRRAVPTTRPPPAPQFVDVDAGPSSKKPRKEGDDVVELSSDGEELSGSHAGHAFVSPASGSSNGVRKPKSRNKVKRSGGGGDGGAGSGSGSNVKPTPRMEDGDTEYVLELRIKYDALRRRISQLEDDKDTKSGNKRADLRAGNLMMTQGMRTNMRKRTGHVPGVEIGDIFFFRMELCLVGLHAPSMAGIDYTTFWSEQQEETIAVSIVSSGGYEDLAEDKDVLIYSGQGGVSVKKDAKEMTDQKLERGNLALENSLRRGNEVRVIRGVKDIFSPTNKVYVYDGLYRLHESWTEKGKSGYNVFKYKLLRIPGQPDAFGIWKAIQRWRTNVAARPGLILPDLTSGAEKLPVSLVNDIDDDKGPAHFTYTSTLIYPQSLNSVKPAVGCGCRAPCHQGDPKCSCAVKNGGLLPYTVNGILVVKKNVIYECGPACHCYPNCKNQVSQSGLKVRLEVFKTDDRGWGLRSWDHIRAGMFICEYAGKVIDKNNVENGKDEDEDDNYVFDSTCDVNNPIEWNYDPILLEEDPQDNPNETGKLQLSLAIDANHTGNVARFMNHSCSPNVFWQPVLYDHHDESFPHIMFYALKHIPPMTELTYDYGTGGSYFKNANRRKVCLCRSLNCRGFFQ